MPKPPRPPGVDGGQADEMVPQIARHRAAPVRRTEPTHRLNPGDLVCGECGEGNLPTRKFCSRCGTSLGDAVVVGTPWWRKLLRRRGPKVMKAGSRPGKPAAAKARPALTRVIRRIRTGIALVILVAGVIYGVYPPFRSAINGEVGAVRNKIVGVADQQLVPEHPVAVTASLASPGHPAKLAADEFKNTYWLAPWSPDNQPTLTLTFSSHVVIKKMIILVGASDNFTAHDRPSVLHMVYSNQESDDVTLKDTSGQQQFDLRNANGVSNVQIQISDVFAAQAASDVAITEIELFGIG
jgi:hypothetical protein